MAPAGVMLPPRVEQLSSHHDVGSFDCGEHPLNYFLRRYAATNQGARISNTYVAVGPGSAGGDSSIPILGYYTLSLLSVSRDDLPSDLVAQVPNPSQHFGQARRRQEASWAGVGKIPSLRFLSESRERQPTHTHICARRRRDVRPSCTLVQKVWLPGVSKYRATPLHLS